MALFTLSDFNFNKNVKDRKGKASSALVGGDYELNILKYPEDIGNYDKGHYMVIHINEQTKTSFGGETVDTSKDPGSLPTVFQSKARLGKVTGGPTTAAGAIGQAGANAKQYLTKASEFITGKIPDSIKNSSVGQFTGGVTDSIGDLAKDAQQQFSTDAFLRTIRRTKETIALYMPDTLNFTHQQNYSDVSMGGGLIAGAAAGVSLLNNDKSMTELGANMSPFVASYLANKTFGNQGSALFAGAFGAVVNPQLELLYSSPSFRSFRFDFMFYPRNEKEALEVQSILNTLKFHQAPEILSNGKGNSAGFFMVPPSEFDIKFYCNGVENPNIPRISTCVLETIDIDYAPNGFSAYESVGDNVPKIGKTGTPVAIRLSLGFKETEILTKSNFAMKGSAKVGKMNMENKG